jgi:hypothetical protein
MLHHMKLFGGGQEDVRDAACSHVEHVGAVPEEDSSTT